MKRCRSSVLSSVLVSSASTRREVEGLWQTRQGSHWNWPIGARLVHSLGYTNPLIPRQREKKQDEERSSEGCTHIYASCCSETPILPGLSCSLIAAGFQCMVRIVFVVRIYKHIIFWHQQQVCDSFRKHFGQFLLLSSHVWFEFLTLPVNCPLFLQVDQFNHEAFLLFQSNIWPDSTHSNQD